jgi:uncharacterized protein YndB with AHSA1/START domain
MPTFSVTAQNLTWIPSAPIVLTDTFSLRASPERVFECLADIGSWSDWYGGMKKVRIDGPASGVGAVRTVWVGTTRVQERFLEWAPGERLTFAIVGSNTPGLGSMVEDWALAADPSDPNRTVLTVTVGVAPSGLLKLAPKLVRGIMASATKGAGGIVSKFP